VASVIHVVLEIVSLHKDSWWTVVESEHWEKAAPEARSGKSSAVARRIISIK
jgi:hypothetical protein